ncbi:MAG: PEGA domain-containing protein [Deltaproteobacteria bacterium]|nr:PEGA domain-containing protein [Deltaproteobacteria bacterium]
MPRRPPPWAVLAGAPMLALTASCAGSGSAPSRSGGPTVTVVVAGDAALARQVRGRLGQPLGFKAQLRLASLPDREAPAVPVAGLDRDLAAARQAYVDADVTRCLELLAGDRHLTLLAQARAAEAARVLFWRLACDVAAGDDLAASADAGNFAAMGLSVPPDADVISPEVEARIAAAAPRQQHTLTIASSSTGARVLVDGRWRGCVTPCKLDVAAGDHVIAVEADGFMPASRILRVDTASTVEFDLAPASPTVAAQQWLRRHGAGDLEGTTALNLLAIAVRARTMVLLVVDRRERGRLRGVLTSDGLVLARGEASWGSAQPRDLVRDLLLRAQLLAPPPLYKRAGFWVGLGAAAAVAAGITAALLFEPEVETTVRFEK